MWHCGTATFPSDPYLNSQGLDSGWYILSSTGQPIASTGRYPVGTNGWSVTTPDHGVTITVSAPSSAQVGNYYVEVNANPGPGGDSVAANFAVIPAASSYLYVSYLGGSTVDVVDPTTFKVVKTISGIYANNGTYGIAESVDGTKVYTGRGTLYALDSLTGNVLASVAAPVYGLSLTVSP